MIDATTKQDSPTIKREKASELLWSWFGKELSTDASKKLIYPDDLVYHSWLETFASTSGPFHGIGGAAMTRFRMEAWVWVFDIDIAVVFCRGAVLGHKRVSQISWAPTRETT